jgi:hypothetical protein
MTPEQQQYRPLWPDTPITHANELSEETLGELLCARREMLRWKAIANQNEEYLTQIKMNSPWLHALIRLIPEMKQHRNRLLLLAIAGLVSLPLWPAILIIVIFPKGRKLLWSLTAKVGSLNELLTKIWLRLNQGRRSSRMDSSDVTPLIYARPQSTETAPQHYSAEQRRWHLFQQLSPQKRFAVQGFNITQESLVNDGESRELLSTSRSEHSLIQIALAESPKQEQPTVYL